MKRTLLIVFALVLGAAILLWLVPGADSVKRMEKHLRLKEADRVDAILLCDAYDSVRLEKQEKTWLLEGNEPVAAMAVENLLYAAQNLQVDAILGDEEKSSGPGTRVVFSEGEKDVLAYTLVAGKAGFILRSGRGSELYRVSLPGYQQVRLETVFSSTANHYREHMLIRLQPSDIHRIEVELRKRPAYCFTMDSTGALSYEQEQDPAFSLEGEMNELAVRRLFSYFTSIPYEDLLGPDPELGPSTDFWLGTLTVEAFSGERHRLEVYEILDDETGEKHMFLARVRHNAYPGILVVKYRFLDVLMRDLSRFFTV